MRRLLPLALAVALLGGGGARASDDLTRYVDPRIGTLGSGFVFPGPAVPFGMVQLSPDTENYFAYTGYLWSDTSIRGFSHVHVESMGVQTAGNIPFMPTVGPVLTTDPLVYMSRFDHATEHAEPGYYRVLLESYGILAELTAGLRVGMHRYTFPRTPQANVLLDVGRSIPRTSADPFRPGVHPASVTIDAGRRLATGTAHTLQGYPVHFAARFSRPLVGWGGWDAEGQAPVPGQAVASGRGAGAYVTFDLTADPVLLVKVGISFVSVENALANLEAELPGDDFGFDALRERARAAWDRELHLVEVEGGTEADRRSFYTALYHAFHHPNVFTDANGEYLGHDGQVHLAEGYTHYTNFSLWDTYRTQMPLLAVLQPRRYRDMVRSLYEMERQGGRFPQWALMNGNPNYMIGEPVLPALAEAFCRGLVPAGLEDSLYAAMREHALGARQRDANFAGLGYIPNDVPGDGGVSGTLEHAVARFAFALVADLRGEGADRDAALRLAGNWRNVFDPETRFVRPRMADGSWMTPYHPEFPDGFVEGNGWQYTWLVPQDPAGLFGAMGEDLARERLDTFFSTPVAEPVPYLVPEVQKHLSLFGILYYGNQYTPANEHDLQAPWLFNHAGQPWKTQAVVRGLQGLFRPTPDGLPGNDDLGTMSAWYAWSALGLYPVTAGAPLYTVGSPVFERATLHLEGGDAVIRAPGASLAGKYVQSARLDGAPLDRAWFTGLRPGRELVLEMGALPNRAWAAGAGARPPSASTHPLGAFGCRG